MSYNLRSPLEYLPEKVPFLQSPDGQLPNPTPNSERPIEWKTKRTRTLVGVAIFLFLLGCMSPVRNWRSGQYQLEAQSLRTDENPILNRTLGFQDIFMLSLPDRNDRREPLLAGANATDLTITVMDAIRDRQIPKSDYPKGWATGGWVAKEGELGCLMSHLRAWRKVIHENITSALVMESDVDWDIRIKQSMVGIGRGAKAIADWPFDPEPEEIPAENVTHATRVSIPQSRPYGDKWDLLWLGHCGSVPQPGGRIYYFNDSSSPDEDHAWTFGARPDASLIPYGTRLVYHPKQQVCTTAYAVTNKGARKLERMFRHANGPIDMKLWEACEINPRFSCVGVWPQVFSMTESRTNIAHTEGGQSFGHEVTEEKVLAGQGIQVSSRVNAYLHRAYLGEKGWRWEWRNRNRTSERIERMRKVEEEFYFQEAPFHTERPSEDDEGSTDDRGREERGEDDSGDSEPTSELW